jgi:hypothetical protein
VQVDRPSPSLRKVVPASFGEDACHRDRMMAAKNRWSLFTGAIKGCEVNVDFGACDHSRIGRAFCYGQNSSAFDPMLYV